MRLQDMGILYMQSYSFAARDIHPHSRGSFMWRTSPSQLFRLFFFSRIYFFLKKLYLFNIKKLINKKHFPVKKI